jgi:hypothetical protein
MGPQDGLIKTDTLAALHENLQHKSVLIKHALQPMLLSSNGNDGLAEMLFIDEVAAGTLTHMIAERAVEFLRPEPDRLI